MGYLFHLIVFSSCMLSAPFSSALMVFHGTSCRGPVFDQSRIRRINGYAAVLKDKSRDTHVSDGFHTVEYRVRISQSCESAHIPNVFTDIDILELVLPSHDLLVDIITIRACGHSIDLDHNLFLLCQGLLLIFRFDGLQCTILIPDLAGSFMIMVIIVSHKIPDLQIGSLFILHRQDFDQTICIVHDP